MTSDVVRYRILLVEDDVHLAMAVQTMLPCYDVENVGTLKAGVSRLTDRNAAKIDCCVVDLTLPNSKGTNAVRRFQEETPEVPMVVVSGYDFDGQEVILMGAQEFLPKPFERSTLSRKIRTAMARHRVRPGFSPLVRLERQLEEMKKEAGERTTVLDKAINKAASESGVLRKGSGS